LGTGARLVPNRARDLARTYAGRDTGRAMSQENVEMIERMYEAFYRGNAEGALANFDPEVEVDASVRVDVGIVHGREGVRATVARWVGAWDEWREEIEEIPRHEGLRRWWDDFLGAFPDYVLDIEELRDLRDVTLGHLRGWGHAADSATPVVDPSWQPVRVAGRQGRLLA
jgi:hypothetical protein